MLIKSNPDLDKEKKLVRINPITSQNCMLKPLGDTQSLIGKLPGQESSCQFYTLYVKAAFASIWFTSNVLLTRINTGIYLHYLILCLIQIHSTTASFMYNAFLLVGLALNKIVDNPKWIAKWSCARILFPSFATTITITTQHFCLGHNETWTVKRAAEVGGFMGFS